MSSYRCVSCLGATLVSLGVFAQAPTGIITGTVTDESGAVVPNVNVTITNKATGVSRAATTNAEGYFSAAALPAGDYEVKAEVTGFRTLVRPDHGRGRSDHAGQHADDPWPDAGSGDR